MKKIIWGCLWVIGLAVQADTVLLTDDFATSIDPAAWTLIKATGATSFDESTPGNQVTPTSGYMYIENKIINGGGAYKSKLLPVNELGEITVDRRIWVTAGGSQLTMPDEIVAEDGTVLLRWGYQNDGFGGFSDTRVPAIWSETDEVITYDPVSGMGSYSNANGTVAITGVPLSIGTTNIYLRGSAHSGDSTSNWKAFQDFTVTQADFHQLTVSSAYGSPVPAVGDSNYSEGAVIDCSVTNVVSTGGWGTPVIRYGCTGWTGTGSVPASGSTNEVSVTLSEDSSITWNWEALDAALTVSSVYGYGSPSPSIGSASYAIGTEVTCSVQNEVTVDGIRYRCTGWTGTGSVPASGTTNSVVVTVGETSAITWQWQNLDSKLTVVSDYGNPVPFVTNVVYAAGTVVTCSVENVMGSDTRHLCSGWQKHFYSDYSGQYWYSSAGTSNQVDLTLDYADVRLTWLWETDHWLDIQVEGSGTVSQASGFYDEGSVQTLTATAAEGWVFDGWSGDVSGAGNAAVTMSGPQSVTAVFANPASIDNLSVAQVEGERVVDVSYDVAGTRPLLVNLEVLQDGSNLNAIVTGDLGMVSPGTNNVIAWNAGADWNHNVDELTFNLLTEDGLAFYDPYEGGAVSVLRTEQTNSYSSYAVEDGDLRPGMPWPEPRFSDNGDNTITDNATGLMWAKSQSVNGWGAALQDCDNSTLAGHDDWRMPNVREMRSLFSNFGRYSPVLETGIFSLSSTTYFWTSTRYEYAPSGNAYVIYSATGAIFPADLYQSYSPYAAISRAYLPVRGSATGAVQIAKTGQTTSFSSGYVNEDGDLQTGTAWPEPRFTNHGDGTVTDHLTGLMWTTNTLGQQTWNTALSICQSLTAGGHDDWRLPSVMELESLVDFGKKSPSPLLPDNHPFSGVVSSPSEYNDYWTGTTYPGNSGNAYKVSFYDGGTSAYSKSGGGLIFACRGGVEIQEEIPEPMGEYPLPQTGQTNSVAAGDDGDVQAGLAAPNPRFTRTGTYTVLDNLTGLLWYISMDNQSYYEYWHSAVSDADDAITPLDIGAVDWRLPNIREMLSLMDLGESGPALPEGHPFQNVQTNANYWTSTTLYTNGTSYAWQVNMADGSPSIANRYELNGQFYAMVYGPTAQPQAYVHKTGQTNSVVAGDDGAEQKGYVQSGDRFTDNGNYTISDNRTGLMWLQAMDACGETTWAGAVEYCENLNYGGYTDWRLPNARELESMVDYSKGGYSGALPEDHPFTDMDLRSGSYFWSSTTLNSDTNIAVDLNLYTGMLSGATKDIEMKVWPVRGGE